MSISATWDQYTIAYLVYQTYPDAPDGGKRECFFTSCSEGLCRHCNHRLDLPLNKTIQFNFVVTVNNARECDTVSVCVINMIMVTEG